ncbi:MAG: hypothetical protein IKF98_01590 [Clostridia bacterium]|nr:hypothetical protein [Clostridia bacterium]
MADKRIQDLTPATSVGTSDRFVLEQSGQAKSLTGQVLIRDLTAALDGHGGISDITYTPPVSPSLDGTLTLTMADESTYDVTITNGNGIESINIAYAISNQGTTPGYVTEWYSSPVPPTDTNPYQWTRIRITDKTNTVTDAYSVSMKAVNPTMTIGSVSAETGANADATVTNSGTSYNPVFNFDFTLPKGDKGDTGDYIDPVASFGTSTAATTEPTTWYNSPSSLVYAAGNFIWQKTEYVLHEAQTVQSIETKVVGYIGQNGTGSGTVTQITFNGDVFSDDGTGNVTMNVDPEDVGAIADPANKSNGQVLTWDNSAGAWVASNPSTGNVNTVNNKGVDVGTTNITLYGTDIKVSSSDNTSVTSAIPQASNTTPAALGTAAVGTGTTWARADHVHAMPSASDVGALTEDDVNYKIYDSVTDLGLTSGSATIAGAWAAMPLYSILICPAGEFVVGSSGVPHIYATVEIKKLSSTGIEPNRGSVHFWAKNMAGGQNDLRMFLTDQNAPNGLWIPYYYQTLWTNPNPTAAFGAQTISIDTAPYRFVTIAFLASAAEQYHVNTITMKNAWGRAESMLNMTWGSTTITAGAQRAFVVHGDNSGIYFENCAVRGSIGSGDNPTALDACLIPEYIVGIP